MRTLILAIVLAAGLVPQLWGQQDTVPQIPLAARTVYRMMLSLEGDLSTLVARVSPGTPPGFSFDVEVYDSSSVLVAHNESDLATSTFRFKPATAGQYTIILRNSGDIAGEATVTTEANSILVRGGPNPDSSHKTVFFATNREGVGTDPKTGGPVFGTELAKDSRLIYGTADVIIPRDRRLGELEGPMLTRVKFAVGLGDNSSITVQEVTSFTKQAFLRLIKTEVGKSMKREMLVFIHGFNTGFDDAVKRTAQIAYDVGFDGVPILFSWPSQKQVGPVVYQKDGRNAKLSVNQFCEFMRLLSREGGANTITVIAHSMGNRILLASLGELNKSSVQIRNAVFMAPDVDSLEFRETFPSMGRMAERATLYASSKDLALIAAAKLEGYPRAGQTGPGLIVVKGLDTVDASAVDTSLVGANHQYYADNTTILSDLFYLIRGLGPRDRFRLKETQLQGLPYWIFNAATQ